MRTFIVILTLAAGAALAQTAPPPMDPQKVQDQDTMTWADYHPNLSPLRYCARRSGRERATRQRVRREIRPDPTDSRV
jgi:hypothetical protein